MTRPQVFQCGPGEPFTDRFQDMLREAMIRDIPRHMRPRQPKTTNVGGIVKSRSAAARRAKDSDVIIRMFKRGMKKNAIAEELALSRTYIDRVLDEGGITHRGFQAIARARRDDLAPRVLALRATGASHAAIGAAIGLASATVARIIHEQGQ